MKPFIFKTTIHKDVSARLKKVNPSLYRKVQKILEINKKERHIRGGIATRKKYKGIWNIVDKNKEKMYNMH